MLVASSGSSSILIIYVVVFGALYFFYLRPRSKRQKAQRTDLRKVEVGQRAQTIGGFVGTVISNDGDLITLRSASGVELDFIPSAIARRYDPIVHDSTDDTPTEGDAK
jgi:preprotein translocase subunit YajC